MGKTGSEGTIWARSLYVPPRLYSKAADLGPFDMSGHQVLISSRLFIFLPKLFLDVQTSSPPHPFNRGSLKYSVSGQGVRGNQQLSIMNSTRYGEPDVCNSWPEPEHCHHPTTRGPGHNMEPDECDHKVSRVRGHACAKEPLGHYEKGH
jgi:hypothetical protein